MVQIPGSHWIWEANALSEGVFTFVVTFTLAEWGRAALTSLKLQIAADDHFAVQFNGFPIAPEWSGGYTSVSQYELKSWALGTDEALGVQENVLEMTVWNSNTWGGIIYRLDLID